MCHDMQTWLSGTRTWSSGMLIRLSGIWMCMCIIGCTQQSTSPKPSPYPADGYQGMTSVNPNMPLNPGYHDLQQDKEVIQHIIKQYPDVRSSHLALHGPKARVHVKVNEQLSSQQISRLVSNIQMDLSTNMPRYQVEVYVTAD
jgi:hypothetical protein